MSTPHICANLGDFAKTVLMLGDPLRAKFIAENYLDGAKCVTSVRKMFALMEKYGILALEMEAVGLYGVAAEYGKKALAVLTVSDHIKSGEQTTADERESTFEDMMELTLESITA